MPSHALEHWVITRNIERFRKLLEAETDPEKRKVLESLLAAEETKLGFEQPD